MGAIQAIQEWLPGLLQASLRVSVVIALVLLVRAMWRRRGAAAWTTWLWALVLVRILIPTLPSSPVSVFNLWRPEPTETIRLADPVPPVPMSEVTDHDVPESSDVTPMAVEASAEPMSQPSHDWDRMDVLALLWLVGALGVAGLALASDLRLWWRVRTLRPVTDGDILECFEDCKTEMDVHTIVGLILTDRVSSPCIFGVVRPRVLLPLGALESLSEKQLRFVFLHELAHLKRWDNLLGWLMLLAQVLHWFNPLVWFAMLRMRTDRELACDHRVLSLLSEQEAHAYGATIMDLSTGWSRLGTLPSMAGIVENRSLLKRRIEMIAEYKPHIKSRPWLALGLLLVIALVTLTEAQSVPVRPPTKVDRLPQEMFDHLLLYYSFDKDGGSKAVDISGMDNHGRMLDPVFNESDGPRGSFVVFDGESDSIEIDDIQLKEFTFAVWLNPNVGHVNNRGVFQLKADNGFISVQGNSTESLGVYIGSHQEVNDRTHSMHDGPWHHYAVTYDGETIVIYCNGQATARDKATIDRPLRGKAFLGGSTFWEDGDSFWSGTMDEVALFNQALTAQQVQQLYGLYNEQEHPAMPPEIPSPREWIIEALVDDTSELWLYPDKMVWHNLRDAKPGRHGGRNEPTFIMSHHIIWVPGWQKPEEDVGVDVSLPLPIQFGQDYFAVELLGASKKRPADKNDRDASIKTYQRDGAFVIRFEDVWAGPAWFKVKVVPASKDMTSPCDVDFVPYRNDCQAGDLITIDRIEGTAAALIPGQIYTIYGRYQLTSYDRAYLNLYATNGETKCKQGPLVSRGQGEFQRTFEYLEDGYLHLSYYPAEGGDTFGGIYFRNPDGPEVRGKVTSRIGGSSDHGENKVVSGPNANIEVTELTVEPGQKEGTFKVVAYTRNTSEDPVGAYSIYFYINDPERRAPRTHGGGPLKPKQQWNECNPRIELKEGRNRVEVVVDVENSVQETNENDNDMVVEVTVKNGRIIQIDPVTVSTDHNRKKLDVRAKAMLVSLRSSLRLFKLDCGRYPTEQEGLDTLKENPDVDGWSGPYFKREGFIDPWGNSIRYQLSNGKTNLTSAGADGQFGTADDIVLD